MMGRLRDRLLLMLVSAFVLMGVSPAAAGPADGTWLPGSPPQQAGHFGVVDVPRNRLFLAGGAEDGAGSGNLWSYSLSGLNWSSEPVAGLPPWLWGAAWTHDTTGDRILAFGGTDFDSTFNSVDVLDLDGSPAWQTLTPSGTPPPGRFDHAGVFDPLRNRILYFGGVDGAVLNDLWILNLSPSPSWQPMTVASPPPPRRRHVSVYDPAGDRMILFGGFDGKDTKLTDVWSLNLSGTPTWIQLAPTGTPPPNTYGSRPGALIDPGRNRVVILDHSVRSEPFELLLSNPPAWRKIPITGNPLGRREDSAFAFDASGDRFLVSGGGMGLCETWLLGAADLSTWQPAPPGIFPFPRDGHVMVYDEARDRCLMIGGGFETCEYPFVMNDSWSLSLWGTPSWTRLAPTGTLPTTRQGHSAVSDASRDRVVVFGGHTTFYNRLNDVRELALGGATPQWTQLLPAGSTPSTRTFHAAIYDPVRDRMIVFGGDKSSFPYSLDDTWALNFSAGPEWEMLAPTGGPPPARYGHVAIYDPVRDRMVIHGGSPGDTWALSLSGPPAWSPITATPAPPQMVYHTAVYDADRDRMVVHGADPVETWALSFSPTLSWTRLTPSSAPPLPRRAARAVYDVQRDRMVLFGGVIGNCRDNRQDLWILQWGDVSGAAEPNWVPSGLIHGAGPNPFRSSVTFHAELHEPGAVTIEIFNVGGRIVRSLAVRGDFGRAELRWDGRDEAGNSLPASVYLYRIRTAEGAGTGRLVRLPQ